MTKRHLFKTSILAGLAAICPAVSSPVTQNIDVAQWTRYSMLGAADHQGLSWGQAGPLEAFNPNDASSKRIIEDREAKFYLHNSQSDQEISREQFKQFFNI